MCLFNDCSKITHTDLFFIDNAMRDTKSQKEMASDFIQKIQKAIAEFRRNRQNPKITPALSALFVQKTNR